MPTSRHRKLRQHEEVKGHALGHWLESKSPRSSPRTPSLEIGAMGSEHVSFSSDKLAVTKTHLAADGEAGPAADCAAGTPTLQGPEQGACCHHLRLSFRVRAPILSALNAEAYLSQYYL